MAWYDEPSVLEQLPRRHRAIAAYIRLARGHQPRSYSERGFVLGAAFMLRTLGTVAHITRQSSVRSIHVGDYVVACDLADTRFPHVLGELRKETDDARILESILQPGDTFIDVGANHGAFSIRAAKLVGDSGRVIAFEPQSHLARLVARSLTANDCRQFEVRACALGAREDRAVLYSESGNSGNATLHAAGVMRSRRRRVVPVTTLDTALTDLTHTSRTVLKIDVEGHELAVLEGARRLLESHRPTIIIEINPTSARAARYSTDDLLGLLHRAGYEIAEYSSFPRTSPAPTIAHSPQRNVVAMPLRSA
jgi:FkbM family methyltransferase